jgi:hypothetical protein
MGKRSAVVELLLGNMGSMQREKRPTMATEIEQIAVPKLRLPYRELQALAVL